MVCVVVVAGTAIVGGVIGRCAVGDVVALPKENGLGDGLGVLVVNDRHGTDAGHALLYGESGQSPARSSGVEEIVSVELGHAVHSDVLS